MRAEVVVFVTASRDTEVTEELLLKERPDLKSLTIHQRIALEVHDQVTIPGLLPAPQAKLVRYVLDVEGPDKRIQALLDETPGDQGM
jgi:hypothetical protein